MKILVVGISVRAMAESAVYGGYAVQALDAFGDLDLRRLAPSCSLHRDCGAAYSPQGLLAACRGLDYDAVAYTANLENHPSVLAGIALNRPIIGNPPSVVRAVRDWRGLSPTLARAGFRVPETYFHGDTVPAEPNRRWLLKPVLSGGGHGVSFARGAGEEPDRTRILQEYIPGKACSASFVADGRESVVIGITEQLIGTRCFGASGFRYCGNILPLQDLLDPAAGAAILEKVRRLASILTRTYGLTGVNGVDFILHEGEVVATEVNPRYSASMELIERAHALSVFDLHAAAATKSRLPRVIPDLLRAEGFFAKAILFAEMNAVAPDTKGWLDRNVRDVPAGGEKLQEGSPVCTVLSRGATREAALAGLMREAERLKEEIYGESASHPDHGKIHRAGHGNFEGQGASGVPGGDRRD